MEEVKKNIQTFLEILHIGSSESVIPWDESNFKRAQRWGQYAEEVCGKVIIHAYIYYSTYSVKNCQNVVKRATNFAFNDEINKITSHQCLIHQTLQRQ